MYGRQNSCNNPNDGTEGRETCDEGAAKKNVPKNLLRQKEKTP